MVDKDYNHPSVVLYSIGNEVPDVGREAGVELNRMLADQFRELDHTRYITNGLNGFMLYCGEKSPCNW